MNTHFIFFHLHKIKDRTLHWEARVWFREMGKFHFVLSSANFPCPILQTLDISRCNITRCCTQHYEFEGKISVRLGTHERQPYLVLTCELCFYVSYLKEIDRDISGAHCTSIAAADSQAPIYQVSKMNVNKYMYCCIKFVRGIIIALDQWVYHYNYSIHTQMEK